MRLVGRISTIVTVISRRPVSPTFICSMVCNVLLARSASEASGHSGLVTHFCSGVSRRSAIFCTTICSGLLAVSGRRTATPCVQRSLIKKVNGESVRASGA